MEIFGTNNGNLLEGTEDNDLINGLAGNDTIKGFSGNDTINAGPGDDWINGNDGADKLNGDDGNDEIRGGKDVDIISGGAGDDLLLGQLGDDVLGGNQGRDRLDGGAGNDELRGGKNDDFLIGGEGDDVLKGNLGNNTLYGDVVDGSGIRGADIFVIQREAGSVTIIKDFEASRLHEKIDIREFGEIGAFADLSLSQNGNDTIVTLVDGQSIILEGVSSTALNSSDFLGALSASKTLRIYKPGQIFDHITGPNGTGVNASQIIDDIKQYVIDDFKITNLGNRDLYKDFQVIDLSGFGVTGLNFVPGTNLVNLGQGRTLEITGLTQQQINSISSQFIFSSEDTISRFSNDLMKDWKIDTAVSVNKINNTDQVVHFDGIVRYQSTATELEFHNGTSNVEPIAIKIHKIDPEAGTTHVIEDFSSNSVIDISSLNISDTSQLIFSEVDNNGMRITTADGNAIFVKNVKNSDFHASSIVGFTAPETESDYSLLVDLAEINAVSYSLMQDGNGVGLLNLRDDVSTWRSERAQFGEDLVAKGWVVLSTSENPELKINESDFFGTMMGNPETGQVVFVFRGTANHNDVIVDADMALNNLAPAHLPFADKFVEWGVNKLKSTNLSNQITAFNKAGEVVVFNTDNVIASGHSLGAIIANVMAAKYGISSITFDNPGSKDIIKKLGYEIDSAKHIIIQAEANYISTEDEQIANPFVIKQEFSGSIQDDNPWQILARPFNAIEQALDRITEMVPQLSLPISIIDPSNWFEFFYADNHTIDGFALTLKQFAVKAEDGSATLPQVAYWPDNQIEGALFRLITNGKSIDKLDGLSKMAWETFKPFIGDSSKMDDFLHTTPVLSTIFELDDIFKESLASAIGGLTQDTLGLFQNIFQDVAVGAYKTYAPGVIADLALGQGLDESLQAIQDKFVGTVMNGVREQTINTLYKDLFPDGIPVNGKAADTVKGFLDTQVAGFAKSVALQLLGRVATGNLTFDDTAFGNAVRDMIIVKGVSAAVDTAATYAVSEISILAAEAAAEAVLAAGGTEAAATLAYTNAIAAPSNFAGFLGFNPTTAAVIVVSAILMNQFGDALAEGFDKAIDLAEDIYKFIGDPINGLEDLWKQWNDDKWSYFAGSDLDDIRAHDSDHANTRLKNGDDVFFGWDGWNVAFGENGNDILIGGSGAFKNRPDELMGGAGRDYINGKENDDRLVGGGGADYIIGGDDDGNDMLWGNYDPSDVHYPEQRDTGIDGGDTLIGGPGDDYIAGQGADDVIIDGLGNDVVFGDDTVAGDPEGSDRFVITVDPGSYDIIKDFSPTSDLLDLSAFGDGKGITYTNVAGAMDKTLHGTGGGRYFAETTADGVMVNLPNSQQVFLVGINESQLIV